jgi:aminotransferase
MDKVNPTSGRVAKQVVSLPRSGIRDFFAIVAQMPDAISLGVGEPDFCTPWHIREATIFALEKGRTSYTDNRGHNELRKAISHHVEHVYKAECYDPEDEILVTVGVSEAIDLAVRAIINPGEKILYHQPCYVSYHPGITLAHGIAIPVATSSEDNFTLDPAALEAAWEPGCKALLLNFPTNPTGGVAKREVLERLAKFACEKDLIVLSDEIYSELTYEGEHTSIASLPGMKDRTIFLHGFSKAYAMTGYRIGYACGPADLIEAMMKVHQYSMMCASILSQDAAVEALRNGEESVKKMKEQYHRRRDLVVRRFNEIGLKCHLPGGAFYAFPDIRPSGLDAKTFCTRLLHEQKVAMVPGTAFGESGKGFSRASYATSYERLVEATNRIDAFVNTL